MKHTSAKKKMYLIITGGQLENKGAQAMTFICISEGLKLFKDAIPVLFSNIDYEQEYVKDYRFRIMPYPSGKRAFGHIFSAGTIKLSADCKEIFSNAVAMFDISGYKLGSNWGNKKALEYLKMIALAKKHSVPVYIMSQSFGPFDFFGLKGGIINVLVRHYLKYPQVIMAREYEGKKLLESRYLLKNVVKAPDIVLSAADIDIDKIYTNNCDTVGNLGKIYDIAPKSVAIIPNSKNDLYRNANSNLDFYSAIVNRLLSLGRNVYLIFHSRDDIDNCCNIKDMFKSDDRVKFIKEELSCIEFEQLIVNFDYAVASRYHSIVHAYKAGVPSIVMGWATKYHELVEEMKQEKYCVDVREKFDIKEILRLIEIMDSNYQYESEIIRKEVKRLQTKNVFDLILK